MAEGPATRPIFHLSFPVRDLDASIAFYVGRLGAVVGRRDTGWADLALFGAQLALQHRPDDVLDPMPRSRHFGATIEWLEWDALVARWGDDIEYVEAPTVRHRGTPAEQAKLMIADPSGNHIEIKAYRDAAAVLHGLAG